MRRSIVEPWPSSSKGSHESKISMLSPVCKESGTSILDTVDGNTRGTRSGRNFGLVKRTRFYEVVDIVQSVVREADDMESTATGLRDAATVILC